MMLFFWALIGLSIMLIIGAYIVAYYYADINVRSEVLIEIAEAICDYNIYCIEHGCESCVSYDDMGDVEYLLGCSRKNFTEHILPIEKLAYIAPFIKRSENNA